MDIAIATAGEEPWPAALARALPEARLFVWPDVPGEVDFAAVWRPPAELFTRVTVRRAIANLGAGVDALLALPTLPHDVPVLRLEDAGMAEQMAEYVTLAVLRAYREDAAYAEQQRRRRWVQRSRIDKTGFVVGVLGLGVLGRAVARPLVALGFRVIGWSRSSHDVPGVECHAGDAGLDVVLGLSRVLACLLPLTPSTRGLLDHRRLSSLPRGAHLVNVARGPLVVEEDLLALLDAGHVATATLDVFCDEPLPALHRFWHHPAVTVTPHVSAATRIDASAAQVAAKFRGIVQGDVPGGIVDREHGY